VVALLAVTITTSRAPRSAAAGAEVLSVAPGMLTHDALQSCHWYA
jgi:hypothetical protein